MAALQSFDAIESASWFAEQMLLSGDDSTLEQLESQARIGARVTIKGIETG